MVARLGLQRNTADERFSIAAFWSFQAARIYQFCKLKSIENIPEI
jgi:hypothetical protein